MNTPPNHVTHAYVISFQWQALGRLRWFTATGGTSYSGTSRAELYLHAIAEARRHGQVPEEAAVTFLLVEPELMGASGTPKVEITVPPLIPAAATE